MYILKTTFNTKIVYSICPITGPICFTWTNINYFLISNVKIYVEIIIRKYGD